ncbi:CipC-like antibiotic response protein [Penicillium angulare]|uniref:CipC-like antibiotic response protein n=1 Tax=Penicillium angulare TaxID=116970 RepID=UPI00253FB100|nr:CipC-like antibiotic response protein [Penicillium angulare]KAJ5280368.1 CipC-like antibiotic response protein [Penicillium angulare]
MAWGWEQSDDAHRQVYGGEQQHHEAKFSHELIAGAASFAGMKAWEDHQRKEGKTVKHAFAKEALVGLVGAEIDKLAESKGMDEADKLRAHHHAKKNAEQMYEEHYERHESRGGEDWQPHYERHERFEQPGRRW